jgi:putative redox protein
MAQDKHHHPVVVSENGLGPYQQAIHVGRHRLLADEPDFLLASLGACTSITLRMYAERKKIPLTGVSVELAHDRIEVEGRGKVDRISRTITLDGDLTAEQRSGLLAIAKKCPMYRTLQSDIRIDSVLVAGRSAAIG